MVCRATYEETDYSQQILCSNVLLQAEEPSFAAVQNIGKNYDLHIKSLCLEKKNTETSKTKWLTNVHMSCSVTTYIPLRRSPRPCPHRKRMGPWVSSCYGSSFGATRLRTVYRFMKANVTGYQPYLQQTENMADRDRKVMVTSQEKQFNWHAATIT